MKTERDSCITCGHECCKWLGFTYGEISGRSIEFYASRGCKILRCDNDDDTSIYRIYVPITCPHLEEGEGCSIYERRPLACIEFEPDLDPIVKDICLCQK